MEQKLSTEESINFWKQRSKLVQDPLSKIWYPDNPVWNVYIDSLYTHYLKPYMLKLKPSDKVLDVGCGIGRFAFRFAKFCDEVYGIDISEENIKFAKEKAKEEKVYNVKFSVMDARALKFDDETFDWVFSIGCIQVITNKEDFIQALRELFRVTKKSGYILLLEDTTTKRERQPNVISLPREEWFRIIKERGGKVEHWCGTDIFILRRIVVDLPFRFICRFITRRNWKVNGDIFERDRKILELYAKHDKKYKFIENGIMKFLTNLIKPFEYTLPKILKNQSWYTVIVIKRCQR